MVRYKISFTILISQAVLYQENISKADQNYVSGFTYIPLESIQKEKEQPMGEKDITEKILEDYNDVFADIINGLVFKGEQRILPESLKNAQVHSQYKAEDGKVHELERDVIKYWKEKEVELAICGIENQSNVKKYMPFRIIGYDGAAYRSQLLDDRKEILPVMTIVLYFGTDHHWRGKKNIKGLMKIPEGLDEYINDYEMKVFEIAWLTEEEISRFRSDFKVVANFFVQKRKHKNYIPDDPTEIKQVIASGYDKG